jgi:hypothetical protein
VNRPDAHLAQGGGHTPAAAAPAPGRLGHVGGRRPLPSWSHRTTAGRGRASRPDTSSNACLRVCLVLMLRPAAPYSCSLIMCTALAILLNDAGCCMLLSLLCITEQANICDLHHQLACCHQQGTPQVAHTPEVCRHSLLGALHVQSSMPPAQVWGPPLRPHARGGQPARAGRETQIAMVFRQQIAMQFAVSFSQVCLVRIRKSPQEQPGAQPCQQVGAQIRRNRNTGC